VTEESTVTDDRAAEVFRFTLADAHRRRGGSPAMREAGRLLAEHGGGARLALRCGAVVDAVGWVVDLHLETAGVLPIDAGAL
jgi:hypothetical protein